MLATLFSDAKIFLTLVIVGALLSFADSAGILNLPKSGLQVITAPIQLGLYKTSNNFTTQFKFITLARQASLENNAIREQMATVLSENANLRRKLAEAEGFLEQSKSLDPQNFTLIPTRPLGISRYLLIDKGSDDAFKKDQSVVFKDTYIGQIKEVSSKKSQVLLSSDPDSHISAFAQNKVGKAKGVLNGQFGSEMLMEKILHEEPIEKGDLIYSDGTEVNIPRGLILGIVEEVISKDNEVFKSAKVRPVYDISDLEIVFVITN